MAKRISKLGKSLKEIGDIQVNDLDFIGLLNKDIAEIEQEIVSSLRRLGNKKVMDWDFNTAMPNVSRVAHSEVDIIGFLKRTASYKVVDWDFRGGDREEKSSADISRKIPTRAEIDEIAKQLEGFLRHIVANLVDQPTHARIDIRELAPGVLRFTLTMVKRDVSMFIGTGGHTAAAVRRVMKAVAETRGVHALLEILVHGENGGT